MDRRSFVTGLGTLALAGCLAGGPSPRAAAGNGSTDGDDRADPSTEWRPYVDCGGRDAALLRVERTRRTLPDAASPLDADTLPDDERALLDSTVEDGQYATCDPDDAFERVVARFRERVARQRERDPSRSLAYVALDGRYHGLSVVVADRVYAWR
ncbi:hypothetical protein [Halomarina ordinaria]|uniref:Tat pathway signal protein n=1 Tax=Halomarina ordinaria TaxID=3033939 RepID=A0ABD5UAZ8_9EURY|nr:hypothetical protein [Halomarina sp. PSRA2]